MDRTEIPHQLTSLKRVPTVKPLLNDTIADIYSSDTIKDNANSHTVMDASHVYILTDLKQFVF